MWKLFMKLSISVLIFGIGFWIGVHFVKIGGWVKISWFYTIFVYFSQCIKVVKYLWRPNTSTSHLRAAKVSKNKGQAFKGFFEQTNFRIEKPQGKSWWHLLKFYTSKSYSNYGFKISGGQTGKIFDYNGSFSEISAENLLFPSIERISVSNLEQDYFIFRNHNFFREKVCERLLVVKNVTSARNRRPISLPFLKSWALISVKRILFFWKICNFDHNDI